MLKGIFLGLAAAATLLGMNTCAFAQAVAESAILHGGSAMSAGIARKLGNSINQSLSTSQQSLSSKGGLWETGRRGTQPRTRRVAPRTTSGAPIAISSVRGGGAAPCAPVAAKPAQVQATATSSPANCFDKIPASEIHTTGKSEITVSFK
jgi:hypothetical protein